MFDHQRRCSRSDEALSRIPVWLGFVKLLDMELMASCDGIIALVPFDISWSLGQFRLGLSHRLSLIPARMFITTSIDIGIRPTVFPNERDDIDDVTLSTYVDMPFRSK